MISPSDRVLAAPDDVLSYYSEAELGALQFDFDALDIHSVLCELWEWCIYRGIPERDRKRAIYGALRKQHAKAALMRDMKSPQGVTPSQELLGSRLMRSRNRY